MDFWAEGFWAEGFWAEGLWAKGGDDPTPPPPSGYSVSWDQAVITSANASAASFTMSDAVVGTRLVYVVASSGGGWPITNAGNPLTVSSATEQVTLDVSALPDGTLTLQVTLTDENGKTGAAVSDVVPKDATGPQGYSVAFDPKKVTADNETAVSFTATGAEVGADYDYTITSSGGGTPVTGSGTVAADSFQVNNIDVSGLADGILTLALTLTDQYGQSGLAVTSTVRKQTAAPGPDDGRYFFMPINRKPTKGIARGATRHIVRTGKQ